MPSARKRDVPYPGSESIDRDLTLGTHRGERNNDLSADLAEKEQQVGADLREHFVLPRLAGEDHPELAGSLAAAVAIEDSLHDHPGRIGLVGAEHAPGHEDLRERCNVGEHRP